MSTPRALVRQLYEHWEIVQWLVQSAGDYPSLSSHQVLEVIARCEPNVGMDEQCSILRQLTQANILQQMPRDDALYVNQSVLEFVRSLIHEHTLGLSEVLQAWVQELAEATEKLSVGIQHQDMDLVGAGSRRMAEMVQRIMQQLEQDHHAIMGIAERAKSADTRIPLERRYREVLEAYDCYIEPMNAMMDSGASGTFYVNLEKAERVLDHAVGALAIRGALYKQQVALRQVSYQVKELMHLGKTVLVQCSNTLFPLRDEIRQHTTLSSSISLLLGHVRQHGLNRTFRSADLPTWRRDSMPCIQVGDTAREIMAQARHYVPPMVAFPADDSEGSIGLVLERLDEKTLRKQLQDSLPVKDIMHWLVVHYSHLSDATILRLYNDLIREQHWGWQSAVEATTERLKQVNVTLYTHGNRHHE